VSLYHLGDWGDQQWVIPAGVADENGDFVLESYASKDGAPAGDYKVTIVWPAPQTGPVKRKKKQDDPTAKNWRRDRLGEKYADAETSPLTAHITEGKNELPIFDLKADLVDFPPDPPRKSGGKKRNAR
jgi:hypothetical protein